MKKLQIRIELQVLVSDMLSFLNLAWYMETTMWIIHVFLWIFLTIWFFFYDWWVHFIQHIEHCSLHGNWYNIFNLFSLKSRSFTTPFTNPAPQHMLSLASIHTHILMDAWRRGTSEKKHHQWVRKIPREKEGNEEKKIKSGEAQSANLAPKDFITELLPTGHNQIK